MLVNQNLQPPSFSIYLYSIYVVKQWIKIHPPFTMFLALSYIDGGNTLGEDSPFYMIRLLPMKRNDFFSRATAR